MAEGFLKAIAGDKYEVHSAGLDPQATIHPMAVQVMNEVGIDISEQYPKGVKPYMGKLAVSRAIIVCQEAEKNCPRLFPGSFNREFWAFDDPAVFPGTHEEQLEKFRVVRDAIRERICQWLADQEEA
jgi:arsenate reductase